MNIGVDVRHLGRKRQSGVGHATIAIIRELVHITNEPIEFLSTGSRETCAHVEKHLAEILSLPHVRHTHRHIPNKFLHATTVFFHAPPTEKLFATRTDVIWYPNLHAIIHGAVPSVISFHDLSFELFPTCYSRRSRLWHWLVRPKYLARNATIITAPSRATAEDLTRIYKIELSRIRVIPHGVDPSFTSEQAASDHGVRSRYDLPRHFFLHVGTQEPRKNLQRLIEGFERARATSSVIRQRDTHLVLVGAAEIRIDIPNTLRGSVHILDNVPDRHLPAIYRLAEALIFPSLYEGFGLPIIEAFASGTPVIASHTSAMLEVGGTAALLIDPYRSEDIATALTLVIEDQTARSRMITAGLARAKKFGWPQAAEQLLATLIDATKRET